MGGTLSQNHMFTAFEQAKPHDTNLQEITNIGVPKRKLQIK